MNSYEQIPHTSRFQTCIFISFFPELFQHVVINILLNPLFHSRHNPILILHICIAIWDYWNHHKHQRKCTFLCIFHQLSPILPLNFLCALFKYQTKFSKAQLSCGLCFYSINALQAEWLVQGIFYMEKQLKIIMK